MQSILAPSDPDRVGADDDEDLSASQENIGKNTIMLLTMLLAKGAQIDTDNLQFPARDWDVDGHASFCTEQFSCFIRNKVDELFRDEPDEAQQTFVFSLVFPRIREIIEACVLDAVEWNQLIDSAQKIVSVPDVDDSRSVSIVSPGKQWKLNPFACVSSDVFHAWQAFAPKVFTKRDHLSFPMVSTGNLPAGVVGTICSFLMPPNDIAKWLRHVGYCYEPSGLKIKTERIGAGQPETEREDFGGSAAALDVDDTQAGTGASSALDAAADVSSRR